MRPQNNKYTNGLFQGQNKAKKNIKNNIFNVIFWNAGGLTLPKFMEFKISIIKEDIDIFGIVEAGAATENMQYYEIPGYQCFCLPRTRQVASGIIVGVKKSLIAKFSIIKPMQDPDKLEAVQLDVWKIKFHRRFIVVYNPPLNKPNLSWLEARWNPSTILYGDLNAPSVRWNYSSTSPVGRIFEDFLDSNPAVWIDNEEHSPTFVAHSGNKGHPDLILAHTTLEGEIFHTLEQPPCDFGHKMLRISLLKVRVNIENSGKATWNFKKANWDLYSKLCDVQLKDVHISNNVDMAYNKISEVMMKCALQSIPRGRVKKYSPFWNGKLQELRVKRDTVREFFEICPCADHKVELRKADATLKKEIISAKRASYRKFVEKLDFRKDGNKAHKFVSKLNQQQVLPKDTTVTTSTGKLLTSKKEIASYFCTYYSKMSNYCPPHKILKSQLKVSPTCLNDLEDSLFHSDFKLLELERAMEKMPKNKSAGPDDIPPEFISHLGESAKGVILKFLNAVWNHGFPSIWRKADIIPIPKKGKTTIQPEDCRPIALTSMFSKLYERMILDRLHIFIEKRRIISDKQAGFRKHRDTVEQVAYLSNIIKNSYHRKQNTIAVFVDLKSAFDKVWRAKLLLKLKAMGIESKMYLNIKSFLTQRQIRVKYDNTESAFKQIKQGVPQGSVLSPTLFNLMVNDVVAVLEAIPGVQTMLYADDLVVWATSSQIKGIETCLNRALESLYKWSKENCLEVNPCKSEYQIFSLSTKRESVVLRYNNDILPQTDAAAYLGIVLDNRLSWQKHIDKLVQNGEKRLGLLKRLAGVKWGATQDLLALTYRTYIRPAIEYGSALLLTSSKNVLRPLDVLQNKALRLVTGAANSTPINALEIQTDTEPLQLRREKAAICLFERLKRLNVEHWRNMDAAVQRLKTQKILAEKVNEVSESYNLDLGPAKLFEMPRLGYERMAEYQLNLLQPIKKSNLSAGEMKALALETINKLYPPQDWLHIYTDGSAQSAVSSAGAGVYCRDFEIFSAVGTRGTNFDGEVTAIMLAIKKISTTVNSNIVLLVDSQAAIIAITSRQSSDEYHIEETKRAIDLLISNGNRIVFQWVPSHCGLYGNERADELAKKGTTCSQPDTCLPYNAAKRIIKEKFREASQELRQNQAEGKKWECLLDNVVPKSLGRREAVAKFRMVTGHDYLQKHLFKIGIVDSPICPLCQQEEMDAPHLTRCPSLTTVHDNDQLSFDSNEIVNLYWAARSRMTNLSTG